MKARSVIAVDLGATSGRVELVRFEGDRLAVEEVRRFPNAPVSAGGTLYWDALGLWREVTRGLRTAADLAGGDVAGVAVDSWGVDFALLDSRGGLIGNPVSYRDSRTDGMLERACAIVPRADIFAATGVQFLKLNTLYQLLALRLAGSPSLDAAHRLLMLPDLFAYWLSGAAVAERTVATTTQFYDPRRRDWAHGLLASFHLPSQILPEIVDPGTVLGSLRPDLVASTGLDAARVIAPAAHDTASAVAAVPARSPDFAYISLGTWSLIGAELPAPRVDSRVLAANFTNEGGAAGRTRLLKNAAGLWLVDECRRAWAERGEPTTHAEADALARRAEPLRSLVDVDSPAFLMPADMPAAIAAECHRTGQPVPTNAGALLRCALDSLAVKYRLVIERLQTLVDHPINRLHVVGGGSRNALLCQLTADATGLPVIAGPAEATAIGNGLVQLIALGEVASLDEGRELVIRSFDAVEYEPRARAGWNEAVARFRRLYPESMP